MPEQQQKIPKTCLLDSNVLISIANPLDVHHQSALEYVRNFADFGVKFYISPVVEAEFENGSLSDLILLLGAENIRRLSYDHKDAQRTKELKRRHERRGASKQAHMLDMMIVSHMFNPSHNIDCVITADKPMISFLQAENIRFIDINISFSDWTVADTPLFGASDLKA